MKLVLLVSLALLASSCKGHGVKSGSGSFSNSYSSSSASSHASSYSSSSSGSYTGSLSPATLNEVDASKTGGFYSQTGAFIPPVESQDNKLGPSPVCCKGPFPGPHGSIYDSKPAESVPQQPAYRPESTSGINSGIVSQFPGPAGSIHEAKPAPAYHGGSSSTTTTNVVPGTTGLNAGLIAQFPGPSGSIFEGKPVGGIKQETGQQNTFSGSSSNAGSYGNANSNNVHLTGTLQEGFTGPSYTKPTTELLPPNPTKSSPDFLVVGTTPTKPSGLYKPIESPTFQTNYNGNNKKDEQGVLFVDRDHEVSGGKTAGPVGVPGGKIVFQPPSSYAPGYEGTVTGAPSKWDIPDNAALPLSSPGSYKEPSYGTTQEGQNNNGFATGNVQIFKQDGSSYSPTEGDGSQGCPGCSQTKPPVSAPSGAGYATGNVQILKNPNAGSQYAPSGPSGCQTGCPTAANQGYGFGGSFSGGANGPELIQSHLKQGFGALGSFLKQGLQSVASSGAFAKAGAYAGSTSGSSSFASAAANSGSYARSY